MELAKKKLTLQEAIKIARDEGRITIPMTQVKGVETVEHELAEKIFLTFVKCNFSIISTMVETGLTLRTIELALFNDNRVNGLVTGIANEMRDIAIQCLLIKLHTEIEMHAKHGKEISDFPQKLLTFLEGKTPSIRTTSYLTDENDELKGVTIEFNGKMVDDKINEILKAKK